MLATAHKLDGNWVAVPPLSCDFFFGILSPNEQYIREKHIPFKAGTKTDNLKENQIIFGKAYNCHEVNTKPMQEFELLDENGKNYLEED